MVGGCVVTVGVVTVGVVTVGVFSAGKVIVGVVTTVVGATKVRSSNEEPVDVSSVRFEDGLGSFCDMITDTTIMSST